MKLIQVIEIAGTAAFALSGALSAIRKRLDIFGILIITFVSSIGGGTIRDMLIGSLPVAWMKDIETIVTISIVYLLALFFHPALNRLKHSVFWSDTLGLAVFCMVAIDKALSFHLHPVICIALGTITGTFGGIIRDVLLNEIPYVFRKDIYASACIAGGIVCFTAFYLGLPKAYAAWLGGAVIVIIRIGAFYFNWQLPLVYMRGKKKDME